MPPLSIDLASAPLQPHGQKRAAYSKSSDFGSFFSEQADREVVRAFAEDRGSETSIPTTGEDVELIDEGPAEKSVPGDGPEPVPTGNASVVVDGSIAAQTSGERAHELESELSKTEVSAGLGQGRGGRSATGNISGAAVSIMISGAVSAAKVAGVRGTESMASEAGSLAGRLGTLRLADSGAPDREQMSSQDASRGAGSPVQMTDVVSSSTGGHGSAESQTRKPNDPAPIQPLLERQRQSGRAVDIVNGKMVAFETPDASDMQQTRENGDLGSAARRASKGLIEGLAPASSLVLPGPKPLYDAEEDGGNEAARPDTSIGDVASGVKLGDTARPAQVSTSPNPSLPLQRQLVEVAGHLSSGPVEVQLSPEELGRVRMTLVPGEAGLVLHIAADRPETLDLLRRHAHLLGREFSDAGFGGLDLTFGSSGQERFDRAADTRAELHGIASSAPMEQDPGDNVPRRIPGASTSSLDIRI